MPKRLTEHEALKILHELEPNYSFYFKDGYKNANTKNLHITCNYGHQYITKYTRFTNMNIRCKECFNNKQRHNKDEILKNLKELEPDYTFRFEGSYKGANTKNLHVTCNHGHEYFITYNNFRQGRRCNKCNINKRKHEEEEVLNNLKEMDNKSSFYFDGGYINGKTRNLYVTCNKGHEYKTSYNQFQQGSRCNRCIKIRQSIEQKHDEEYVLKTLYDLEPNYSFKIKDGYKGNKEKNILVTCHNNHEYVTSYNIFQRGSRCPRCANHKSRPESEIIRYLKTFYFKDIQQSNRTLIKNKYSNKYMELDIYLPDIKLAIEFNGRYWHSDKMILKKNQGFSNAKEYHEYKTNQCKQLGITLLHIDEQDFIDDKQAILESIKHMVLYSELLST